MKFTINRSQFADSLVRAFAIAPTKHVKDVIQYAKATVRDGELYLMATDLEITIEIPVGAVTAEQAGECLIGPRLLKICREVMTDDVSVHVDEGKAYVTAGVNEWTLVIPDPDEFPEPKDVTETPVRIQTKDFQKAAARTVFATCSEWTRYALGGVQLSQIGSIVTLAATDSRRLSVHSVPVEGDGVIPKDVVVPVKLFKALDQLRGEEAEISVSGSSMQVTCDGDKIWSRLVEGRFPNYQDVLPKTSNSEFSTVSSALSSSLRQSTIVTNAESRGVDMSLDSEQGSITLTSSGQDVGSSSVSLPVQGTGAFKLSLDPTYVLKFLRTLDNADSVEVFVIDATSPVKFTADGTTYIVMPLSRDY